jgi:hypothetical protein
VQEWKQPSGYSSQISDTYVRNGREYGDWQRGDPKTGCNP